MSRTCQDCARPGCRRDDTCYARSEQCHRCGKQGHYARCCEGRGTPRTAGRTTVVRQVTMRPRYKEEEDTIVKRLEALEATRRRRVKREAEMRAEGTGRRAAHRRVTQMQEKYEELLEVMENEIKKLKVENKKKTAEMKEFQLTLDVIMAHGPASKVDNRDEPQVKNKTKDKKKGEKKGKIEAATKSGSESEFSDSELGSGKADGADKTFGKLPEGPVNGGKGFEVKPKMKPKEQKVKTLKTVKTRKTLKTLKMLKRQVKVKKVGTDTDTWEKELEGRVRRVKEHEGNMKKLKDDKERKVKVKKVEAEVEFGTYLMM